MNIKVALCARVTVTTTVFNAILTTVERHRNNYFVDDVPPIEGTNDRRLLIDLLRLHADIDDSGVSDDLTTSEGYGSFVESIFETISPGYDAHFNPYQIEVLLIDEDKSAV